MSKSSNNNGRAFEYITLKTLKEEICKVREVVVMEDKSYDATKNAWENIDEQNRLVLKKAAKSAVKYIFDFLPMILDDGCDILELFIQPDRRGKEGDVRDILIVRKDIHWEIGLSLKHNHFAVKHSRLAKNLDFGKEWYGVPCSNKYWEEIEPIFKYLEEQKSQGVLLFKNLPDKMNDVYIPLLNAFKYEVLRSYNSNQNIAKKMAKYLLGKYDFYKIISEDSKGTQILTFNSSGTLNQASRNNQPKKSIPILDLPKQIIDINFKPRSKTTIIISMDKGWKFSFRIHNANDKIETSLKFDIQLMETPSSVNSFICK